MRLRIGPEWPLGLIIWLVCGQVLAAFGYLFWSGEVEFFRNPSAYPILFVWHQALAAEVVFVGLVFLVGFVLRKRGVLPTDEGADREKRYSDRDDF